MLLQISFRRETTLADRALEFVWVAEKLWLGDAFGNGVFCLGKFFL